MEASPTIVDSMLGFFNPSPAIHCPLAAPAVLAFSYDPTTDANMTLSGTSVQSITDMTGNGRHGTAAGTTGPDRGLALINGVNGLNFSQTNLDSLLVGSALSFSNSQPAIGMDGVFQFNDFALAYQVIRIYTSVVAGNRFAVQITTTGKIRIISRRLNGDLNGDVTSTIGLTLGVPSFISVQVDYANGTIRVVIDGLTEVISVFAAGGVVGWTSKTGLTEATDSSAPPVLSRIPSSSSAMNAYVGSFRCWTGSMRPAEVQAQRMAMQTIFNTPLTTVSVNAPVSPLGTNKFYRATNGFASVPVGGKVVIGSDSAIEMRLIDAATRTPHVSGWNTITTSSGLVWAASPSIPAGSWFLQFRKVGERDADAITDTSNRIGVGYVVMFIGQSNAQKWWCGNRFSPYPVPVPLPITNIFWGNRRWSGNGWFSPEQTVGTTQNGVGTNEPYVGPILPDGSGGNGLSQFCTLIQTAQGIPIACLALAIGGTALSTWMVGGSSWNYITASMTLPGAPNWDIDGTLLVAGEADGRDQTSYEAYRSMLGTLHNQIRTATGNPHTKLWIAAPGPSITLVTTDASLNAVLDATLQYIEDEPDAYLAYSSRDIPLSSDNLHPNGSAYQNYMAPRFALTFRNIMGLIANSGVGPEVSGGTALIGYNSAHITVTHHGGTTLVDGTGNLSGTNLTGLSVVVDGTTRNIMSSALNAGAIDITWDGPPTISYVDFGVWRGRAPNTSNPIRDNAVIPGSAVGSPLQPTKGLFRIVAT